MGQMDVWFSINAFFADLPSGWTWGHSEPVYKAQKDLAKAKEYWEKAYAIFSEKLGPNHPYTKGAKAELDALKE